MTKEEILSKVFGYHYDNDADWTFNLHKKAMEEFAKQECIEFTQWIADNHYISESVGGTGMFDEEPEELYRLYLKSKELI